MIRRALLFIRKKNELSNDKILIGGYLLFILLSIMAVFIDIKIDFNRIKQFGTALLALIMGTSLFSSMYLTGIKSKSGRKPLREIFSQKQRINISIIIAILGFILVLVLGGRDSAINTLITSFYITLLFSLAAFSRYNKNEYIQATTGAEDERDIKKRSN